MTNPVVLQECRQSIAKGSKTFTFASRFFAREKMEDAAMLYQWCRHCDDAIDACPTDRKEQALSDLNTLTQDTLAGSPSEDISFQALHDVVTRHSIPSHYPLELIAGMAMDTHFETPQTLEDLKLYCYRVAGVVGLMMAHVMGVSDERALKNACDLGMAMQMTNIARDILTDHAMGRCYLPIDVLARHGLNTTNYAEPSQRKRLAAATEELLSIADQYYASGQAGTVYLDRKSALVILIARYSYARIGDKVRRAGALAWQHRQVTSSFEKLLCLGRALATWTGQTLKMGLNVATWRPEPIKQTWRFQ